MLRMEASADAMGSTFSLVLYGEDRNRMEAASSHAFDEARRLDNLLSNYKPESEWSRVNRLASDHPVAVSGELFDLLSAAMNYSGNSEGAFDITVGPLMQIWGFYKDSGHLPKPAEVALAMGRIGYRSVVLDPSNHTVFFAKKDINLDPGGIGKGYAVDKIVEILRRDGIGTALVSAGGSSIYCLGVPPGEPGWTIRVKHPRNPSHPAAEITLKDESISTSGSAEKFFVAEGKTWSHIMDPRTGFPAQGTLSVSVVAPRTLDSEVWAKPYFINGRQWTAQHKPRDFRVFFCSADERTSAVADTLSPEELKDKADQVCAWLP